MKALAPYHRPATLAKLDGRTKEARLMREVRADLNAHIGGTLSITQRALIERAVHLTLQVCLIDRKAAEAGGTMTEMNSRTYLAWSNSLTRTLKELGLKGAAQRMPTLADHFASRATS
jgi:hypothetical protein